MDWVPLSVGLALRVWGGGVCRAEVSDTEYFVVRRLGVRRYGLFHVVGGRVVFSRYRTMSAAKRAAGEVSVGTYDTRGEDVFEAHSG